MKTSSSKISRTLGSLHYIILLLPPFLFAGQALAQVELRMPPTPNAPWQPSWSRWAKNPSLLTLIVKPSAKAQEGTVFTVLAGIMGATNVGAGCAVITNAPQCDVPIRLDQPIHLRITGSNIDSVYVQLVPPNSMDLRPGLTVAHELLGSRRRPTTPASFKTYVDGVETNIINHVGTNNCGAYDMTWTIMVRFGKDALRRNPGGNDGTTLPDSEAPGDARWTEIGPGKNNSPAIADIKWSVGLGRLFSGMSAGRLHYVEEGLNSNSYTPNAFFFDQPFTNHAQVIVLTNTAITNFPVLRQIRTPQAFLDIPSDTTNSVELRFYQLCQVSANTNAVSGYYDILTNSPFVLWRFSNPDQDPTVTRRLRIAEERPGVTYTNDIEYNPTNLVWSLTRGIGSEQYRETRSLLLQTNIDEFWLITNIYRFETNQVRDGAGRLAYNAVETYGLFDWGWELTSTVVDPATNALTTAFTYYDQPNGTPDYNFSRLKRIINPDGSWEIRRYAPSPHVPSGGPILLQDITRPYKDLPEVPAGHIDATKTDYTYDDIFETGEIFPYATRRHATNGNLYRFDNTRKSYDFAQANTVRETYQVGWLPDCMGARVRDGVVRYVDHAPPEACGQMAMTLTNYTLGITNTYQFGVWSDSTFTVGAGNDWRKTSVSGLGSLFDPEDSIDYARDKVQTIPGKSIQRTEIRKDAIVVASELYGYTDTVTNGNNFSLMFRDFYTNDVLGHAIGQRRVDAASARELTLRTADWQGTNAFPGQLLLSETDADGMMMRYTYDSLKRLKSKTLAGTNGLPDYVISFTYDACDRVLSVKTNAGSLTLSNSFAYDLSGRITKSVDHIGLITAYAYPSNGLSTAVTNPGGATFIKTRFLSGEPKSETGTAIVPRYFSDEHFRVEQTADLAYQKHTNAFIRTTYIGSSNSYRKLITAYNLWEQPVWDLVACPFGVWTNKYFYANHDEDLTSTESLSTDPLTPIQQYYAYDSEHHGYASWLFVNGGYGHYNRNLLPVPAPKDRLVRTEAYYTNISGSWFRVTNSYTYLTDTSATSTLVSSIRHRLNGFGSAVKAEIISIDVNSNSVTETVSVDRAARKVTRVVTSSASTLPATSIAINGLVQSESTLSVSSPTLHYYDALRRPIKTVTPLSASMITTYDSASGRVTSTTDFAGNTTSYSYYGNTHTNAGRVSSVTAGNGKKTYYAYNFRGDVIKIWGDVPYPEERIYNDFGELVELRTYRGGAGWNGTSWPASPGTADVTLWSYGVTHGLLAAKTDAAGRSVQYGYYTNNQMRTREWARGVFSTNIYDALGDLERLDYSDGTPSVLFTNFNRAGQPATIVDAAGERTNIYDHASRLVADVGISGLFAGIHVSNHFHSVYGRDMIKVLGLSSAIQHDYTYDTFGRLDTVASGVCSADYDYQANTDMLQSTTSKNNGATVLTTSRIWQYGMRLQSIANVVNGQTVSSHNYLYDAAHRRTHATLEDASLWKYEYNDRNELISGKRYWSDWTPAAGQQFEYGFDNIGNRTSTKAGGNENGASLRAASYSANGLNQITNRTVPSAIDVIGAAKATASVTVNSSAAYEKGEYFCKEVSVSNGSGPAYPSITVTATEGANSTNQTGSILVPPATQNFSYDADGNLTNDSVWSYTWDGENRLTQMTNLTTVVSTARKKLVFAYDFLGRRITKKVYPWSGSSYSTTPETDLKFLYDGWNLIAELNATNDAVIRSYMWGQDMGGTMDAAGGIGGLVLLTEHFATPTNHFVGYDGNGNIVTLADAANNSISARYEYSPFGEAIRVSGPFAKRNAVRWSTKYVDEESGLAYYGSRFYGLNIGRFINRDPIEEQGGLNLYAFVANNPVNGIDPLGESMTDDLVDNIELLDRLGFIPTALSGTMGIPSNEVIDEVLHGLQAGGLQGIRQFATALEVGQSELNFGTLGYLAGGVADNPHLFAGSAMGQFLTMVGAYKHQLISIQANLNAIQTYTPFSERFLDAAFGSAYRYPLRVPFWPEGHHVIPMELGGLASGMRVLLPPSYHSMITAATRGFRGQSGDELLGSLIGAYGRLPLM